jgi:hypothetical protein
MVGLEDDRSATERAWYFYRERVSLFVSNVLLNLLQITFEQCLEAVRASDLIGELEQLSGRIEVVMVVVNIEDDLAQGSSSTIAQQFCGAIFIKASIDQLV